MANGSNSSGGTKPPTGPSIWRPFKTGRTGAWLAVAFVLLALLVSLSPGFTVGRAPAELGEVWMGPDVFAPYDFLVSDELEARNQRQRIQESFKRYFRYDVTISDDTRRKINDLMTGLVSVAESPTSSSAARSTAASLGMHLTPETLRTLMEAADNQRTRGDLLMIAQHVLDGRGVTGEKSLLEMSAREGRLWVVMPHHVDLSTTFSVNDVLEYPRETVDYLQNHFLPTLSLSPEIQSAYLEVAHNLIRPNIVYDDEATRAGLREALSSMDPGHLFLERSRIISRGERVNPVQLQALQQLASDERYYNFLRILGAAVFVGMAAVFMTLYARKFRPDFALTAANVMMVALPVVFAIAVGRLALNMGATSLTAAYAFPAGMVGMIGVIFFDARFALMMVTLATMLFGIASGLNHQFMLVSLVGGFTGVASLYTIKERKEVVLAGVRIALVNALTILAVLLIVSPQRFSLTPAVGGILNGLACYVLTVAALPFFEMIFGVTTDVRLMELTSTYHPLLREMEDKVPGSFQHSLNVAKLAESAAEDVGAHYLLVRAGAYFHDIGKMVKPKYYSENQTTLEERRIHSRLSPYMSNLIIKNHVKDGVELAHEYNLPEKVIDFIPQHHGTSLIKYFYAQALQKAEANDIVREEEFRYPGPKPQSIEAAIVMLADAVEATATAKFTSGQVDDEDDLRKVVRDAIFEKFHDGQFDECHMTFHNLHVIEESFVKSLMSRFHKRIDYPTVEKRETREPSSSEAPAKAGAGA